MSSRHSCGKARAIVVAAIVVVTTVSCGGNGPPRNTQSDLATFSRVDQAHALSRGANITVAVIDWQFDPRGTAASNYIAAASMVPGEVMGDLKPGHGAWMVDIVHRVAPDARIMPIIGKSLKNRGYQDALVQGIRYAAEHGAAAVSSSMGTADQTDALRAAIDFAESRGTLFINVHPEDVAVGDERFTPCGVGVCDTRIVHAGIVSVPEHPTKPNEARLVYTWPYDLDGKFEDGWGYSNGPPVVLGVVALVKSANPNLTPAQVRELLARTAYEREGFLVLDAEAAVRAAIAMR
ncbi:MAG: S8 family serine peptidase [Gemmatimonadaceae bacterium]